MLLLLPAACVSTPEPAQPQETPKGLAMSPPALKALADYSSGDSFPHFKAFAWDPQNQAYGTGWGRTTPREAIERALYSCGRYGNGCVVLAVGDIAVHGPGAVALEEAIPMYYRHITRMNPEDVLKGTALDTDQIMEVFTDRNMRGETFAGVRFVATLSSSGEAVAHLFRHDGTLQRTDNGIWWAEHDRLCRRFGSSYSGHRVCHRVFRDGEVLKIVDEQGNLVSRVTLE